MKSSFDTTSLLVLLGMLITVATPGHAQVNDNAFQDALATAKKTAQNIYDTQQTVSDMQGKYNDVANTISQETATANALQSQIDAATASLTDLQTAVSAATNEVAAAKDAYNSNPSDSTQKALDVANTDLQTASAKYDGLTKQILGMNDQYSTTISQIADATAYNNNISAKITALQQSVQTYQQQMPAFWQGGSGTLDTTTVAWNLAAAPNGPFNSSLGISQVVYLGANGSAGTVTLSSNFTGSITTLSPGYTLALAGHNFNGTFGGEATTIDFGGGASSFVSTANPTFNGTITITNFALGSDSLRFGTDATGLNPSALLQLQFANYSDGGAAQIDANGFVTPTGTLLSAVPEPSTYAAMTGVVALGAAAWRRRRREVGNAA